MDSLDWKDYDADTICQRVTSRVRQGSIVLFHNAALHTPEALPAILTCLINDGYTVVPISQLILPQPYTTPAASSRRRRGHDPYPGASYTGRRSICPQICLLRTLTIPALTPILSVGFTRL